MKRLALVPERARSAREALADALHGETMQRLHALGRSRSPKSRTREADFQGPLYSAGGPVPASPEPLA